MAELACISCIMHAVAERCITLLKISICCLGWLDIKLVPNRRREVLSYQQTNRPPAAEVLQSTNDSHDGDVPSSRSSESPLRE